MTRTEALAAREAQALLPVYRRRPVAFTSGRGTVLYDVDGREYLDFLGGLAVTALGHAHPAVTEAIAHQAATLVHTCNLYLTEPQIALAERLKDTLGWESGKVFFANSGAEANEGALKLARRHGRLQDEEKVGVVALSGGFHGRTLATLYATGSPEKHAPFEPLGSWITHVPKDDAEALDAAVDERTCAVLLEVIQGEGGVHVIPDDVLVTARDACDRNGALLIVDEVQTGIGRTGSWYAFQQTPVVPDVVTIAKALANGLPIGAFVAHGAAAQSLAAGDHGSTFGGGPVPCAAALAVLETIDKEHLIEHGAAMGALLRAGLEQLADVHAVVVGVRGRGLLLALELAEPLAAEVVGAALQLGLVVNDVAPDAIRLAPPLTVSPEEIEAGLSRLHAALEQAGGH